MGLVKEIYKLTSAFPKQEQFGLTSQMRRAATSILANLAEGFSRVSAADKAHKYTIARGECSEVQAFLLIAIELQFLSAAHAQQAVELVQETGKIITGLIRSYTPS